MFKTIRVEERITAANDKEAEALRQEWKKQEILSINLMSSPGSGKTTLLKRTVQELHGRCRIGVLEADIDSDVDAKAIDALGARTIQLHTDGMCHVDADMMRRGVSAMGVEGLDIVFLENVGNLICPAEFDTGCGKSVMILSVPEGDDKPLKYPLMFQTSDVVLLSKIDALGYFDFSVEKCAARIRLLNPHCLILPLSAKTGEGFSAWIEWLEKAYREVLHD